MQRFKAIQIYLLLILITGVSFIAGCGGGGETGHWLPVPQLLMSIEVTPQNQSIAKGTTQQFVATGIYSDNTKKDLTATVTWNSSNTAVATISNTAGSNGLASGLAKGGPITITATDPATAKSGTSSLTVTAARLVSIGVTPVHTSVALGVNPQFIATGIYSDTTTQDLTSSVTWTSSNTAVATISNTAGSNGVATSKAANVLPITITATSGLISGNAALTVTEAKLVSIAVTPVNTSVALGINPQFIATGIYSDASTQDLTSSVSWTSSDLTVATISNAVGSKGLATSKAANVFPTTITATDPATTNTGTATLTVTAANLMSIGVTPVNASVALGTNQPFVATGVYTDHTTRNLTSAVIWSSSNTAVATVSNADGSNGLATPMAKGGPITIRATSGLISGNAALTVTEAKLVSIAVTPVNPSIALGTNQQFIATGRYSDATTKILTTSVTWTSSDLTVATISNAAGFNGLATSLSAGTTTITATSGLISGNTTLTVTPATLVSIAVTPINPSIARGSAQQFIATGTYTAGPTQDLTSSVTWSSSATNVATISNVAGSKGLATSLVTGAVGLTTITATVPGTLIRRSTTLTVTGATLTSIMVTPLTAGIPVGATQQFVATGTYSDFTTKIITTDVTWTTTPLVPPVATIDNAAGFNGLATALTVGGPITITATDPITLVFGTARLTVTKAPNLLTASPFGAFGGSAGMTNQGILTIINGDIGTTATTTSSVTGFHDTEGDIFTETGSNIGTVNGTIYTCTNSVTGPNSTGVNPAYCAVATQARLDAQTAYLALAAMPSNGVLAGNLAGTTINPGVYTNASSVLIQGGDLTLDALGDANAVFVFQIGSTLTVGGPGAAYPQSIILTNGAQAKNVFWQVGTFATINAGGGGTMEGTIISQAGVSFSTAGNVIPVKLNGRALSLGASVTMTNTVINVPAP